MPSSDPGPLAGLLTLTQARQRIGRSRDTVYWLIRAGELEAVIVDGQKFVTIESADRYLAAHSEVSEAS